MLRQRIAPLLVASLLTGCATLLHRMSEPEARLDAGLTALAARDYPTAFDHLVWVVTNHPDEKAGQRALKALVALDLDPRNPGRRLNVGAQLAARYLRLDELAPWDRPMMETVYLLAIELGGAEERAAQAEADASAAEARARRKGAVPTYSGQTVTARISAISEERDRLRRRVGQLERELADKESELQRIRKAIKP